MNKIVRSQILASVAFILAGVSLVAWFYLVAPSPLLSGLPGEVNTKVEAISDIEHLRNFALLMTKNYNDMLSDANHLIRVLVNVLFFVCLGAGSLLLQGAFRIRNLHSPRAPLK